MRLKNLRIPSLHRIARRCLYIGLGVVTAVLAGVALTLAEAPPEVACRLAARAPEITGSIMLSFTEVVGGSLLCDAAEAEAR